MKQLEVRARLAHIADAVEKIQRFTAGKSIEEYVADDQLSSAVERQLTIVGEAVVHVARLDSAVAASIGNFPRIIAFRNQLVHNYPAIDHDAVWLIVQRELPALLQRVQTVLGAP